MNPNPWPQPAQQPGAPNQGDMALFNSVFRENCPFKFVFGGVTGTATALQDKAAPFVCVEESKEAGTSWDQDNKEAREYEESKGLDCAFLQALWIAIPSIYRQPPDRQDRQGTDREQSKYATNLST